MRSTPSKSRCKNLKTSHKTNRQMRNFELRNAEKVISHHLMWALTSNGVSARIKWCERSHHMVWGHLERGLMACKRWKGDINRCVNKWRLKNNLVHLCVLPLKQYMVKGWKFELFWNDAVRCKSAWHFVPSYFLSRCSKLFLHWKCVIGMQLFSSGEGT